MWYHIGMLTISRKSQSNKEDYKMTKEARQAQSRVRKLAALLAIGLLASGVVFAEGVGTVGLWKLDWDAATGLNLRSLVDPADDLSVEAAQTNPLGFGGIVQSSGGPSNPGSSEGFLDTPENVGSLELGRGRFLTSSTIGATLNQTNAFTFEGWWYRTENPGSTWFVFFDTQEQGANQGDRLLLSLRLLNGKVKWVLYEQRRISDVPFPGEVPADATNEWHHVALTHDPLGGDGRNRFELFMDGVSYGAITSGVAITSSNCSLGNTRVSIGGRKNGYGNNATQRFDYLRLSDRVLQPEEFLCAPGPGVATHPTLAYWKLGYDAETGALQGRDSVGGAHLGYSAIYDVIAQETRQASVRCAFEGQPPNPTVNLPNGNRGSALDEGVGERYVAHDLGPYLELTNDFTVEGWVLPKRDVYDNSEVQYVWNTRFLSLGWALELRSQSNSDLRYFSIFAQEDNGGSSTTTLCASARVSPDAAYHGEWMHVALTYRHADGINGEGVWRFYIDGAFAGAATNSQVLVGTSQSQNFYIGGRSNNALNFSGHFDCVRASRTALEPAQFLNGTASSDSTVALWPLNSTDGFYLDCEDICGNFHLGSSYASKYRVTGSTENPGAMPNPDTSPDFRGDSSASVGSFHFGYNTSSYVASRKDEVMNQLDGRHPFTLEGWFRRSATVSSGWQLLFGTSAIPNDQSTDPSVGAMKINMTLRPAGYIFLAAGASGVNDVVFPLSSSADAQGYDGWRHLALTFDPDVGNGTWELFVDGTSRGTLENATKTPNLKTGELLIGGRHWNANTFAGEISNVRLSRRVLAPEEFLNHVAQGGEPSVPATIAYWKLDRLSNGDLDYGSQVDPRYGFRTSGTAPSAVASQMTRRIPNPDRTPGFAGDSAANVGAADFNGAGALYIQNLGVRAEVFAPFTVEGWMNWTPSGTPGFVTLCATYFPSGQKYGWRFGIETDANGTARFSLKGRTARQPTLYFVNAKFPVDIAGLAGSWHHVALVYTPAYGETGCWRLYLDGALAGSLPNASFPIGGHGSHWFTLGGEENGANGFRGQLDSWRLVSAALAPEDFLFHGYQRGFIVICR